MPMFLRLMWAVIVFDNLVFAGVFGFFLIKRCL